MTQTVPESWPDPSIPYLKHLSFASPSVLRSIKRQGRLARGLGLIADQAYWIGELYAKEIEEGLTAKTVIKRVSDEIGYGVFSAEHLVEGAFVGVYTGVVRQRAWFYRCDNDYSFSYPRLPYGLRRFFIDASREGNETRYINHGGRANCEADASREGNETRYINHGGRANCEAIGGFYQGISYVIIRTTQEISLGEQLCYHYGENYWSKRSKPLAID